MADHQQLAQQLLLAIRAIPSQIPGYTVIPPSERRRLTLRANLPVAFLNSAAIALDTSEALVLATGLTGDIIRDAIAFRNALLPVADEMDMRSSGIRHTVTVRLSDAGAAAHRVYAISKTINRKDDREVLIPHIDAMRRHLARPRQGEQTPGDEIEPQPQPIPGNGSGPKK